MTDKNREFAELVGICWHELEKRSWGTVVEYYEGGCIYPLYKCTKCGRKAYRQGFDWDDFSADPRLVLREMMKRDEEKYTAFVMWLIRTQILTSHQKGPFSMLGLQGYAVQLLNNYILDTTGLLRDKAILFMEEVKDVTAKKDYDYERSRP